MAKSDKTHITSSIAEEGSSAVLPTGSSAVPDTGNSDDRRVRRSQGGVKRSATGKKRKSKKGKKGKKGKKMVWWKKVLWWVVGIVSGLVVIGIVTLSILWWRGLLPTREELPRYKAHLVYMLRGFQSSQLPEGDVIGIDISHYQGDIEWEYLCFHIDKRSRMYRNPTKKTRVRDVDFVVAKATQGARNSDSYYKRYKSGCRERGILFGAYHFYSYQASAQQQANHFIKTAQLQSGDIVPILDVEPYHDVLPPQDSILCWLRMVEKYYNRKPLIYTSEKCYLSYFAPCKQFDNYSYWIARYGGREPSRHHIFWQYSENGKVGGISGPVDIDVFRGTMSDLRHKYTLP